jgi:hypothetical protein
MTTFTRVAIGAMFTASCLGATTDLFAQARSGAPGPAQGRGAGARAIAIAPPGMSDDPLSGPVVTNAPFSADAITTVTQILSDGTRIEQTTTARFYRDSAGRVRTEQPILGLAALDPSNPPRTTISVMTDPSSRLTYTLDPVSRTARSSGAGAVWFTAASAATTTSLTADRLTTEQARTGAERARAAEQAAIAERAVKAGYIVTLDNSARRAVRVEAGRVMEGVRQPDEALGTRQMEGVAAVGRRTKSVIPTGQIGNDRPIEITDERWESPDLRLLVRSHHRDPRTGDVEYRLTNIVRAEPPADLFTIPSEWTIIGGANATPAAGAVIRVR